jgi:hypothetical protein
MKNIKLYIAVIGLSLLMACEMSQTKQGSQEEEVQVEKISEPEEGVIEESMDVSNTDREPTDDELNEFGIVTLVEDSGYPFYYMVVEFPEREMEATFQVNMEDLNYKGSSLEDLMEQYMSFYYLSDMENNLLDMTHDGQSVLGEEGFQIDDQYTFTGILHGAYEATPGDLPGLITINNENGESQKFELFVTQEMVAVNGKLVRVYFTERVVNRITYIRPSESE